MNLEYIEPEDRYDIELFNRNFAKIEEALAAIGEPRELPETAEEIYEAERPEDWIKLPEPCADEVYFLIQLPPGSSVRFAQSFDVLQSSGGPIAAAGTVEEGVFKPLYFGPECFSNGNVYIDISADELIDETSDGMKQVVVKVSGKEIARIWPQAACGSWNSSSSPKYEQNIVEIACRLPKCVSFGGLGSCKMLRYFAWFGENKLTNCKSMFEGCTSIEVVRALYMGLATTAKKMYNGCKSLKSIAPTVTDKVLNFDYVCTDCAKLRVIPFSMPAATTAQYAFLRCKGLARVENLVLPNLLNAASMFYDCSGIEEVVGLDLPQAQNISRMFTNCVNMVRIDGFSAPLATNAEYLFSGAAALAAVLGLNMPRLSKSGSMFANCGALKAAPLTYTAEAVNVNLYNYCTGLSQICGLDVSSCKENIYPIGATSLRRLTFKTNGGAWQGVDINLSYQELLVGAGVAELAASLPEISESHSITLSSNTRTYLTDELKASLTAKGWVIK